MNSLKINNIRSNITFRSIRNINRQAKTVTKKLLPSAIAIGSCIGAGITYQNRNDKLKERINLKEQAIKYNEEEPDNYEKFREDLINRIMNLNKTMKEKSDAGEEMSSEEIAKALRSEKMEEGRMPDFSETEMDDYDNEYNSNYTPIKMNDLKKESAIIRNKQIKKIAETICKKDDLNKSMLYYLRDFDAGLSNITDSKISKHIKLELKRLADIDYDKAHYDNPETGQMEYFFSLSSIGELVDAYNTVTGKYSRYKAAEIIDGDVLYNRSKPADFIKYLGEYSAKNLENFITALNTESDKKHPLVTDFESSEKTEALEQLSNQKELLDYIYEKYYVSQIPDNKAKKLCKEINRTYGVRVLLSNKTNNIRKTLSIIKKELEGWTEVSGGKVNLPRILDLNSCDSRYFKGSSAYSNIWGNIHYNGAKIYTHNIIRHEIMHINEGSIFATYSSNPELAKLVRSIIPTKKTMINGKEKEVLDWENCKYREEFLKAGISAEHIGYAYTNKNEFLAVAAEGDFSQYSLEFKEVLIKMGMPEYVFNLPIYDADVKTNVKRVQNILKKHPKVKYKKLVQYIEEAKFQELSPQDRLLNAVFGGNWKKS